MPSNPQNIIIEGLIKNDDNNNNNEKQIKKRDFPYEIVQVDSQINKKLLKDFTGECTGFVQVGPQKWLFRSCYEKECTNYYNFEVRPDDVWICTFPRSEHDYKKLVCSLHNDEIVFFGKYENIFTVLTKETPSNNFCSFQYSSIIK